MLASQGGGCAICGNLPKKSKFAVDHDHKTGLIRGILCLICNHKLLAGARESIAILYKALDYLTNPPAVACFGNRFAAPRKPKK